jgi:hypothetical protein
MFDKIEGRLGAGAGQAIRTAPGKGEIEDAMQTLERAITGMVDDLRDLNMRLEPVLNPMEQAKDGGAPTRGYNTPLGRAIGERAEMISSLSRAIRELTDRVQL